MRAVPYSRVSDTSQVEGHSLDAQERLFRELCRNRGWEPGPVYREEGKSAHVDSIKKRPVFRQLLEDAAAGKFDVVVVHTLDRWSRNLRVMLESMTTLAKHGVGLVSITENIDYSTPHGKMATQMLGSVAEFFSEALATHVKKGIGERAGKGLHLGSLPFGFESCYEKGQLRCEEEHPGGVHPVPKEAEAVRELFRRYPSGTVTLSKLATWLNSPPQNFRTRNKHKLPDADGNLAAEARLFTIASVRGILHNPFHMGKVRHREQLLPGAHEPIVSEELFNAVQSGVKGNSGRSETLHPRPEREYLLKGLIRCAHCLMPMWAQTYANGHRYYREQHGSRGAGYCVGKSGSIPCHIPDDQMGRIVEAILLPEAWMDRVLSQIHLADEVTRVQEERKKVQQRLKRLGRAYVDGLYYDEDYRREKRLLEDRLTSLVIPGVDAAKEAGRLLEDLPRLWEEANLAERRKLLLTMLDAVYVDTVEEKAVVAIRPKSAFVQLLEVATTREGSGVVLINEKEPPPDDHDGPEAPSPCLWWRRGRVELPVQKAPCQMYYRLIRQIFLALLSFYRQHLRSASRFVLDYSYRRLNSRTPDLCRLRPRLQG